MRDEVLAMLRSSTPVSFAPTVSQDGSWTPFQCATAVPADLPLALPVDQELVSNLQQAVAPWSTKTHFLFPAPFRAAVRALVMVQNRTGLLQDGCFNLWSCVLAFVDRDWFFP